MNLAPGFEKVTPQGFGRGAFGQGHMRSTASGVGGLAASWRSNPFDIALAAIVLVGLVFAFVGLASSSYFVDELFTLYLIDHQGGLAEVLRRALTDTGPPAYYFALYEWTRLTGVSEIATRLLSALFASAAVLTFLFGTGSLFSERARLFAAAVAVAGRFWFIQSQMVRAYAPGLLISMALIVLALSLRRRAADQRPSWRVWAALTILTLLGCLTHFYLALEGGLVVAYLVLTVGDTRLKTALLLSGILDIVATAAYAGQLLRHTQQDVRHLWFSSDSKFLVLETLVAIRGVAGPAIAPVMAILIIAGAFRVMQRPRLGRGLGASASPDLIWAAGLASFVLVGMVGLGVAVSVTLVPSFSGRNLLIAAPMVWMLCAAIFDLAAPRLDTTTGKVVALVIVLALAGSQALHVVGRFLPRLQEWRASARYVDGLSACDGQAIPVMALQTFAPNTPHFLRLTESRFYGHYERSPGRLQVHWPTDFGLVDARAAAKAPATATPRAQPQLAALMRQRLSGAERCPVLVWQVHHPTAADAESLRRAIALAAGVSPDRVAAVGFPHFKLRLSGWRPVTEAYVFVARPPPRPGQNRNTSGDMDRRVDQP